MADITKEEHLHNPANTQSENPANEITPAAGSETINLNQESKNMEVHHHAHDPVATHHKKNWKSYFWEFLMLFLAVFCGFLAEYQLEHLIEHQREKKYAALLYADLKSDTAGFNLLDSGMLKALTKFRTRVAILKNSKKLADSSFARIASELWAPVEIKYTSTTFNQMKTSGSLRYIRNDSLIAKLSTYYDRTIPDISRKFDFILEKLHTQIEPTFSEYFNIFDNSTDSLKIKTLSANSYLNRSESSDMIIKNRLFLYFSGVAFTYKVPLKKINVQAAQLLNLLEEEYHLN